MKLVLCAVNVPDKTDKDNFENRYEWVNLKSSRIWRGGMSSKHWRHLSRGAWKPKLPKKKAGKKRKSAPTGQDSSQTLQALPAESWCPAFAGLHRIVRASGMLQPFWPGSLSMACQSRGGPAYFPSYLPCMSLSTELGVFKANLRAQVDPMRYWRLRNLTVAVSGIRYGLMKVV